MKIISKYKDYYDYLVNIYGIDEKLILDRRQYNKIPYIPSNLSITTLHIGEYMIQGLWYNGKLNFGEKIEPYSNQTRLTYFRSEEKNINDYWCIPSTKYSNNYCLKEPKFLGDKSPTWKHNCAILEGNVNYNEFPILREYNVNSFIEAHDIWLWLSEWLSKKISKVENKVEPVPNNIKIISAGFDIKTSFRKI